MLSGSPWDEPPDGDPSSGDDPPYCDPPDYGGEGDAPAGSTALTAIGPAVLDRGHQYAIELVVHNPPASWIGCFIDWGDGSDPDGDGVVGEVFAAFPTQPTHLFRKGGQFTVFVAAQDESGNIFTTTTLVEVSGPRVPEIECLEIVFDAGLPLVKGRVIDDESVALAPVEFDTNGDGLADGVLYADPNGTGEFWFNPAAYADPDGNGTVAFRAAQYDPDGSLVFGPWASISVAARSDAPEFSPTPPFCPALIQSLSSDYQLRPRSDIPRSPDPVFVTADSIAGGAYLTFADPSLRWDPTQGTSWAWLDSPGEATTTVQWIDGGLWTRIETTNKVHGIQAEWISEDDWSYSEQRVDQRTVTIIFDGDDTDWEYTYVVDRSFSFIAWRDGVDQYYVMTESLDESFDYAWTRIATTADGDYVLDASFTESWFQSFERSDLGHRWFAYESFYDSETTDYEASGGHSRLFSHDEYAMSLDGQWTSRQWADHWQTEWSYEVDGTRTASPGNPQTESRSFDYWQRESQSLTSLVESWSRQDQVGWWGLEKRTDLFASDGFEKTIVASLHVWGVTDYSSGPAQTQSSYVATFVVGDVLSSAWNEQITTDDRRLPGVSVETDSEQERSFTRERHFNQQISASQTFEGWGDSYWSLSGTVSGENTTASSWAASFENELVGNDVSVVGTTRTLHLVESGEASGGNSYRILSSGGFEGNGYAECANITPLEGTTEVWQSAFGSRSWDRETTSTAVGQTVAAENGYALTTTFETFDSATESGQGSFVAQSYDRAQVQADGIVIRIGSASHQAQTQGIRTSQYRHKSIVSSEFHPELDVTESSNTETIVQRTTDSQFNGLSQGSASYDVLGRSRSESTNYQENGTEWEQITEQVATARIDSRTSGYIINSLFTGCSLSTRDGTTSFEHTAAFSAIDDSFVAQTTRSELATGATSSTSLSNAWSLTKDYTTPNKRISTETTSESESEASGTYRSASYSSARRDEYHSLDVLTQSHHTESGSSETSGWSRTDYEFDDQTGPVRHTVVSEANDEYQRTGEYLYSVTTTESAAANGIHQAIEIVSRQNGEIGTAVHWFESTSTAYGTEAPAVGITRTVSTLDAYWENREGTSERIESFASTKRIVNGSNWFSSTQTELERERGDFSHGRTILGDYQATDNSNADTGITISERSETSEESLGEGIYHSDFYFERNVIDDQWSTISSRADHTRSETRFERTVETLSELTDRSRPGYDRFVRSVSRVFEDGVDHDWFLDIAADERRLDGSVLGTARREDERHMSGETRSHYAYFEKVSVDHVDWKGNVGTRTVAVTTTESTRLNAAEFSEDIVLIREVTGNEVLAAEYYTRSEIGTFTSSQVVHVGGDPEQPESTAWTVSFTNEPNGVKIAAGEYFTHAENFASGDYDIQIESARETDALGRVSFSTVHSYREQGERFDSTYGREHATAFEIQFSSSNSTFQSADFLAVAYAVAVQNINGAWNRYSEDDDQGEGGPGSQPEGGGEPGNSGNSPEMELPIFVNRSVRSVHNGRADGETTGASTTTIDQYLRFEQTTETADYGQAIPLVIKESAYTESGIAVDYRWESAAFHSIDRRPEPFTDWYQTNNQATVGSQSQTTTEFVHSVETWSEQGPEGYRSNEKVANVDATAFQLARNETNSTIGTALVLNAGPGTCNRKWNAQSETASSSRGNLTVTLTLDESYFRDGTRTRNEREVTATDATSTTDTHVKQTVVEKQVLSTGPVFDREATHEEFELRFDRSGGDNGPSVTTIEKVRALDGGETVTITEQAAESGWNRWKTASTTRSKCEETPDRYFVSHIFSSSSSDDGGYDDENSPYGGTYAASRNITEVKSDGNTISKLGWSSSTATIKGRAVESSASTRKAIVGGNNFVIAEETTETNRAPGEGESFEPPSRTYEITTTHNITFAAGLSATHSGQTIADVRSVESTVEESYFKRGTRASCSDNGWSGYEEQSSGSGYSSSEHRTVVKRYVVDRNSDGSEGPAAETIISSRVTSKSADWSINERKEHYEGRLVNGFGVYAEAVSDYWKLSTSGPVHEVVVVCEGGDEIERSESRFFESVSTTSSRFVGNNSTASGDGPLHHTSESTSCITNIEWTKEIDGGLRGYQRVITRSSFFDRLITIVDGEPHTAEWGGPGESDSTQEIQPNIINLPSVLGNFVAIVAQEVSDLYRGLVVEVFNRAFVTVATYTVLNFGKIVDGGAGFIDGFLDSINPFDQWLSIPDIGPSFGHKEVYTGGYIVGTVGGMAASFVIGSVAGGGLIACNSKLAQAAKLYTLLDSVALAGAGVESAINLYNGNAGLGDLLNLAQLLMPLAGYGLQKLGLLGKPHCFVAGTQVVVGRESDGSYVTRSIEEIAEGDLILARDQYSADSAVELCRVARVFVSETDTLRVIVLRDASGNEETITTTDEHPFWVDRLGWVEAGDLELGQVVLTAAGGRAMVVGSRTVVLDAPVAVYNLEVEGAHTYFVEDGRGEQTPLWVHNACKIHAGEVHPYKAFNSYPNRHDDLIGHEILQNAWLRRHGKASHIRNNPALAVSAAEHARINSAQYKAGLFSGEVLDSMTRVKNIRANLEILRELGYREELIQEIRRQVLQFARRLN